jgi:hypothetical protein
MTYVGEVVEFGAKRVRDGFASSPARRGLRFVRTGPKEFTSTEIFRITRLAVAVGAALFGIG